MDHKFKSSDKIGDIVTDFPKAIDTFKEYNIDFCCGGNRPLSDALKEQNIKEQDVIDRLNQEYENFKDTLKTKIDWRNSSFTQLIDYIINTHHSYLQKELPELGQLVAKILRVHGEHHQELARVHRLFNNLKMELESHMIKEEEILFPIIKDYEKNPTPDILDKASKTIVELENEHTGAGDILKELRSITNQYTIPPQGCTTYNATYQRLEELEADMFQHIHLENNILFPRIQALKGAH